MRVLQCLQSSSVLESRRQLFVSNFRRNYCHVCQLSRSAAGFKVGFLATVSQQKKWSARDRVGSLNAPNPAVVPVSNHEARILVPRASVNSLAHNTVHTGIAPVS